MKKKGLLGGLMAAFALLPLASAAQSTPAQEPASPPAVDSSEVKTGFNFGVLPVVAYDADTGFKYGGLTNLYFYGDGSSYPLYRHSLYLEWSRTTRGSGVNMITYDSPFFLPGVRLMAEASLLTEKALDFYGFNGAEAYFNTDFFTQGTDDYLSRVYYRHDRSLLRLRLDLQGDIIGKKLRWFGGVDFFGNTVAPVDVAPLNEDAAPEDILPEGVGLFQDYLDWGVIPADQAEGGNTTFLKAGAIWDTRDNEPNPMSGIWTEAFVAVSAFGPYKFGKFVLTHRQFLTVVPKRVSFAYRLSFQPRIFGEMPFYMLPFVLNSTMTRDGLGGGRNIRGVLRNRVVGEGFAYANAELRWKAIKFDVGNQNFYIALVGFTDAGQVTDAYEFDTNLLPEAYRMPEGDVLHFSYGGGLRIAMNENFMVAVDYGISGRPEDGTSGFYISLNNLF